MIFVLGDCRTATTSIHHWLLSQSIRSVHYFIAEAGLTEPLHRNRIKNWPKLLRYLRSSRYKAFSDYPVRTFYREICEEYPQASYILSVRRDVQTWRRSMLQQFGSTIDIDFLQSCYVVYNEEIRALCTEGGRRFFELCVDEDCFDNGLRLGAFLGIANAPPLPHLNASPNADTEASGRVGGC